VIGTAIKKEVASAAEIEAACTLMTTPNGPALAIARRHGVSACTDVTGFGLLGHLRNILRGSALAADLEPRRLPLLPGAREHAAAGLVPGGSKANLEFLAPDLRTVGDEDALLLLLAADAQTSGGLLLCVDASAAPALVDALCADGLPATTVGTLREPASADGEHAGTVVLRYDR
jgi:selenide, water dikinase